MANKREEQLKEITERLEQGVQELFTSERYREYLNTMAKFHNYSFNNTLLITMQRPDATLVAGYQAWQKKFNRHVLRGEKGIQIISPAPIREKEEVEKIDPETNEPILKANGQPETEIIEHVIPRFKVATVFDVSQTEGEPLPDLGGADLTGQVADFTVFMEAIRNISPVPIRFAEIEGTSHGYYHNTDKEIVIKSGMSESQTMKTAIHEVTHALLHDRDLMEEQGVEKDKMTKEVEAESVAYIVCQHLRLDSSEYSFPYIAGWSSDRDMKELRASMDLIRKTAEDFIENMMEQLHVLQKEHPLEKTFSEQETSVLSFEEYQRVELFDVPALFANGRVDLASLPEGIYRYELRGADYDPGYPLTIEKNVTVNHAATILTVVPLNIPEQGYLRIGEELNMTGGMQHIPEYQSEMSEHDLTVERKKTENAIGRANESLYLSGTDNRYAIYQIAGNAKGREYAFMGMDFVTSHGMTVQGADYAYIYGGLLSENDTLDSLYQTFNINHPENYTGHSLSVSDVVVVQRNGEAKAYYVDSFGFKELPDFVQQRIQEAEMNHKREDSMITLDTTGVKIEQHEGLWHTVDKMEIENEIFYLMRHNEYGDSVTAVILNADGELVAQDLENGFDQDAMEAIREFLEEKGVEDREMKAPFIARYYVVNDAYGVKAEREYQYFTDINEALGAYHRLVNHLDKQIGMESTENPPSRMPLISCKNGIEEVKNLEFISLSDKWINSETKAALEKAEQYLQEYDKQIAYWLEKNEKYLFIQEVPGGFDYTFYDKEYGEVDGGIYEDFGMTFKDILQEIMRDELCPSIEECKVIDSEELLQKVDEVEQEKLQKEVKIETERNKSTSSVSDRTAPEKALCGKSCAEIEETVLCFAQAQLEEMGLENEVTLIGARVYGSRTREGLYKENSDLDVVLSYTGNIREDTFFNCLNEYGMAIAGLKLDINPISEEKTGTLAEYMEIAEKYLDDKEVEKLAADIDQFSYDYDQYEYDDSVTDREENVRSIYTALTTGKADGIREWLAEIAADENDDLPENVKDAKRLIERMEQVLGNSNAEINHEMKKTEATISFYAAECMEFPVLGEYHENLTLEEALAVYEKIPAGRMNGIKGIGFVLHDGSAYDNAEYELMSAGQVRTDMIDLIPHYKESSLVQKAITDVKKYLENQIAKEFDKNIPKNKERQIVTEKLQEERNEISQQQKGGRKESVLQALRERQAKLKAQEQAKQNEKSHTKKKGEQEL